MRVKISRSEANERTEDKPPIAAESAVARERRGCAKNCRQQMHSIRLQGILFDHVSASEEHPARLIARRHKPQLERCLAKLLARSGVARSRELARVIWLLSEGAISLILVHGDRGYSTAAAKAAKTLVGHYLCGSRDQHQARQP